MTNLLNIFPFHENEEKFSYDGACTLRLTDINDDIDINFERGPIVFNDECEFHITVTISNYVPSNALLFQINLSELYQRLDRADLTAELLIISGRSFFSFYGTFPDEYFTIEIRDAYSTSDKVLFIGEINHLGVSYGLVESLGFCIKLDRTNELCEYLKEYFIIDGQNQFHEAPDMLTFPRLPDNENNTIFRWSGVSAIKYLNTSFYSLQQDINDEIDFSRIAENIILENNNNHLVYSVFSVEFRGGKQFPFIILYLEQTNSNIKIRQEKIIFSLYDSQIQFLDICPHDTKSTFQIEYFNVIADENTISLLGKFCITTQDENEDIYRADHYSIIISFKNTYEITEFILDCTKNYQIWYHYREDI